MTTDTKSPEELTQIYLSYLYKHTISELERKLSAIFIQNTPIDYILTAPVLGTNTAKLKLETAAVRAGFKGSSKTQIVSKQEAETIYTLQSLGRCVLQEGETIVACCMERETVYLMSFRIQELSPKLKVREATMATGSKCGSSYLNQRFRRYLKQQLGEGYWNDDRLVEANNNFEEARAYSLNTSKLIRLTRLVVQEKLHS